MPTQPFDFGPDTTLQEYFAAMQGGMPQPNAYQPPTATFEQLMSAFGGWNPTAQSPSFPEPTPAPQPNVGQIPAPEGGTSPGYGAQPGWGPFSNVPMPTQPGSTLNPGQWDFWGQDSEALQPLQNWASFMQPWLQNMQNTWQYQQDFSESARRYDEDSDWSRYADQFAMDINARQQQAYEAQQALQAQQWLEEFTRSAGNDEFSQSMALQNLMLNQARLKQQQEAAYLQAYGRSSAPGRFAASWG